jgi:plasmid stabilization system protein ParE
MRSLRWTSQAETDFASTILYLKEEWGSQKAIQLIDRVDHLCQLIQNQPYLFPVLTDYSNIRKCFVSRHNSIFFPIQNSETIEILAFWNNRKNPENLDIDSD